MSFLLLCGTLMICLCLAFSLLSLHISPFKITTPRLDYLRVGWESMAVHPMHLLYGGEEVHDVLIALLFEDRRRGRSHAGDALRRFIRREIFGHALVFPIHNPSWWLVFLPVARGECLRGAVQWRSQIRPNQLGQRIYPHLCSAMR